MSAKLSLQAALPGVRRLCSAAPEPQQLREELVHKLLRLVGADGIALSTTDPSLGLLTHTIAESIPAEAVESYMSVVYPEVDAVGILDLARSRAVLSTARPALYDDVFQPHGLGERVTVVFSDEKGLWGWVCLVRERGGRPFSEAELHFLRAIAPSVAEGLRRGLLHDTTREGGRDKHPDAGRPGVLVVGAAGRILLRDDAAALHLEDLAPGSAATDVPAPAVAGAIAHLRLRRHDAGEAAMEPLRGLLHARGSSGRWYEVSASAAQPGSGAVLVVIAPRASPSLIGPLYGLSAREEEVLVRVARGESTKTIAQALSVSTHTVQEYVSRASEKVGVRGRKALVAKLFLEGTNARQLEGSANRSW